MVKPSPPQWAVDAGLPSPNDTESFIEYCVRLGFNEFEIAGLFHDLTPRTAPLCNSRLAALLVKKMPDQWNAYKSKRYMAATGQAPRS